MRTLLHTARFAFIALLFYAPPARLQARASNSVLEHAGSAVLLDPGIGAAKSVLNGPIDNLDGTFTIEYEILVENMSTTLTLEDIQVTDDLAATFTHAIEWSITSLTSSEFSLNPSGFNGTTNTNLLAGTDDLPAKAQGRIQLSVRVQPAYQIQTFMNQVRAAGTPSGGSMLTDLSTRGPSVDPDNDGDPANNSIETPITIHQPTLAVELTGFKAEPVGEDALLTWRTLSETNNAGFSVERSFQEGPFEELGFVEGAGTTTTIRKYSYTLPRTAFGRYVFRLKVVDLDGSFLYGPEIEMQVDLPHAFAIETVYPNPFNPSATVRFAVRESSPVRLGLYTLSGQFAQLLYEGTPPAGVSQTIRFDATGLTSGAYLMHLVGADFAGSRMVTVLK